MAPRAVARKPAGRLPPRRVSCLPGALPGGIPAAASRRILDCPLGLLTANGPGARTWPAHLTACQEDRVEERESVGLHHRIGLVVVAALMLGLLALMPIVVGSSLQTLLHPTTGQVYPVAT